MITVMVNSQLASCILDTGSGVTLVKRSAALRLGTKIDKNKIMPNLYATNGSTLRVLGMIQLTFQVGHKENFTLWVSVVPDSYLGRDILLGCDVIHRADLTWRARHKVMVWGGRAYDVSHIRCGVRSVRRVRINKAQCPTKIIQLKQTERLEPYQSKIIEVPVSFSPGTNLILFPQSKFSTQTQPLLVTVSATKTVPTIIDNTSKVKRVLKAGVIVAHYEEYTGHVHQINEQAVHNTISNELVPTIPNIPPGLSRQEKLETLIANQDWSHLNRTQQNQLRDLVLTHQDLFVLEKTDLGTITGPPSHINISDHNPCRTAQYRYPEKAKQIITEMLSEMEARDIIEPSTAAWLSPIVLVNKPDGSKRLCLDF